MSDSREWLIQWIRDAHAMEEQAETMLSGQLSRLEVARACEQNLWEEEAMADWLRQHLPGTTEQFLARADTESQEAKR
jgi:ferritin-like metal-binding protein YciE